MRPQINESIESITSPIASTAEGSFVMKCVSKNSIITGIPITRPKIKSIAVKILKNKRGL